MKTTVIVVFGYIEAVSNLGNEVSICTYMMSHSQTPLRKLRATYNHVCKCKEEVDA